MKCIFFLLVFVFVVFVQVQIIINIKVKVDLKNNKVSNLVVEKFKVKLMLCDELWVCIDQQEVNSKEVEVIKVEQVVYKVMVEQFKVEKVIFEVGEVVLGKQVVDVKVEKEVILQEYDKLIVEVFKLEKVELKVCNEVYFVCVMVFGVKIDVVKVVDVEQGIKCKVFSEKVDVLDVQFKVIEVCIEVYYDVNDKWKVECGNKFYDENDEKVICKEKVVVVGK